MLNCHLDLRTEKNKTKNYRSLHFLQTGLNGGLQYFVSQVLLFLQKEMSTLFQISAYLGGTKSK